MNKPIRSILVIYESPSNRIAFHYIRTRDGATCEGYINAGQNNLLKAFHYDDKNGWRNDYFYTVKEMKSREFDRYIKELQYVGSSSENIIKFALETFKDGKLV
jgi:predicted secreted protein